MISIIPYASSSQGNLYLLKQNENTYLVECGVGNKEIMKYLLSSGKIISQIKGCFISHQHTDHALSCKWINEYMPIYANVDVIDKFELQGTTLRHNTPLMLGDMKVLPFDVEHGKTPNLGFIFKDNDNTILFATDLMKFTSNLSNIKFNKIYIECNYDDMILNDILTFESESNKIKYLRQINTHMSVENLKVHLRTMNLSECNEIVLLHPSKWCINKRKVKADLEHEFKIKTNFAKEK